MWNILVVPEDQLVPGRRVLARSLANQRNYDAGFIYTAMDVMIFVQFDNSMTWFYDTNDIAAIVIDKNPDPKDVVVGTQVVAKRPNESSHVEGKIIEINEEDGKMAYRIDFWDGVGNWNTLEQIRVLTTTKPGGTLLQIACYM